MSVGLSIAAERSRPAKYDDMTESGTPVLGTAYPGGVTHAVEGGRDTTRCGRPLAGLVEFPDLDFVHTFLRDRCQRCTRGLSGLRAWVSADFMYDEKYQGIGRSASFDWCRFRRMSQCWKSGQLDEPASQQAGYAVWVPVNQGHCPRVTWADQQMCPIGAPGPNAGVGQFLDATVAWEDGGQHDGIPTDGYSADEVARWDREGVRDPAPNPESASAPAGQPDQPVASPDPVVQLEHLAELRGQGAITEDEFTTMKAKVING